MNSKLIFAAIATPLLAVAIATPGVFTPPALPGINDVLTGAQRVYINGAFGPESLVFDPSHRGPYTGVADGRILKWNGGEWVEFAVTSFKRMLSGIQPCNGAYMWEAIRTAHSSKTGDLYIADAYLGLQVVGPAGGLFTNDMDIDEEEDVIYFTDSSSEFHRREFIPSIFTIDKTGKLMKYDISSKRVTILLQGLAFANGVSLSKDRSFLLVAETTTRRILRYWLQGPDAGKHDTFTELPGFLDNI